MFPATLRFCFFRLSWRHPLFHLGLVYRPWRSTRNCGSLCGPALEFPRTRAAVAGIRQHA